MQANKIIRKGMGSIDNIPLCDTVLLTTIHPLATIKNFDFLLINCHSVSM